MWQERSRLRLSRRGATEELLRVPWTDHRTNESILSRLEVEKILQLAHITKLKLRYHGYIMRKTHCLLTEGHHTRLCSW